MPQPWGELNLGDRLVVMALPTFGKTTLCEKLAAPADRALFFSTVRDFEKPERGVFTVEQLEAHPELLADPHSRIAVRAEATSGKPLASEVEALIECLEYAGRNFDRTGRGGRVVVFDEVGDYRRHLEDRLNTVFRKGRHFGIVPIFASQVATDLPLKCRKLASRVLCLGQRHADELKELRIYGAGFAERVGRWAKYEPPIEWRAEERVEAQ